LKQQPKEQSCRKRTCISHAIVKAHTEGQTDIGLSRDSVDRPPVTPDRRAVQQWFYSLIE